MSNPNADLRNLMILFPVDDAILARLRQRFQVVRYHPEFYEVSRFGWYADEEVSHQVFSQVPQSEWEEAEVIMLAGIPRGLRDRKKQLPRLWWIQLMSAGAESILKTELIKNEPEDSNLLVSTASGVHALAISQHVFMMIMALYHRLQSFVLAAKVDRRWLKYSELPDKAFFIPDLRSQKIGILGYGGIGREVGRVAKAWGMEVLACNSDGRRKQETSYMIDGTGDFEGVLPSKYFSAKDPAALEDFFRSSDIVVLAAPSSPETHHIVNQRTLACMPAGSLVINIARGDLVDQDALLNALDRGVIRGAGLDVTTPEPLPDGHPLFTHEKIVLTPHICGRTEKYLSRLADIVEVNHDHLQKGKRMYNLVRLDRGY